VIHLDQITQSFGERTVLSDCSLRLTQGSFNILFGSSGAGKTVLLALIAGLEHPTQGRVFIGGVDMTHVPPHRRPVTLVFQRHALFPHLTVFENIAFSLRARGRPKSEVNRFVADLLELVDIAHLARQKPDMLSGGQCQRVAFARALASEADVVLFDEPLCSLDLAAKNLMIEELRRIHRLTPFTALYVTHNIEEAHALGGTVHMLRHGHIAASGHPRDLLTAVPHRTPAAV